MKPGVLVMTAALALPACSKPAWGWKGAPEQRPTQRLPGYESTREGRARFVRWAIEASRRKGLSHESAVLYVAHLARETGFGASVWNHNFGNIKASDNPRGPWMVITDRRGFTDKYRAFDTAEDGLENSFHLLRDNERYATAWDALLRESPDWYRELGLAGYYEGPPDPSRPGTHTRHTQATLDPVQFEYQRIVATVREHEGTAVAAISAAMAPNNVWLYIAGISGVILWVLEKNYQAQRAVKDVSDGR